MSTLTLTLRPEITERVDMTGLTPDKLQSQSQAAIGKIKLQVGGKRLALARVFKIEGSAKDAELAIKAAKGRLDYIGRAMTAGRITVYGAAGDFLGQGMRNGHIIARSHTGRWAGRDMRGGTLEILGNAGDYLAAAFPGDTHGMREGLIYVRGNAGARCGERMRRGIVIIDGDCGIYCGNKMIAGTIMVLGEIGAHIGTGMKRGTIITGYMPENLPATFNDCGEYEPAFLTLLFRQLAASHASLRELANWPARVQRLAGDLAAGGKGEILVMQA
ncbi:MAG: formylmethanofuran dehydrogenase subunit C [Gammaproteobacteria bacterium]